MLKRTNLILLLILAGSLLAGPGDFNGDGYVDMADLTVFAGSWLSPPAVDPNCDLTGDGTINLADYAVFATAWTGSENFPPTVQDVETTANAGIASLITLSGSDTGSFSYVIESLPAGARLYDVSSGRDDILSVPYTLRGYTDQVQIVPDSNSVYVFDYHCDDGQLQSASSTVTVTAAMPPRDAVKLEGASQIMIPHHPDIDLDDNFSLGFWVKTLYPTGGLITKRIADANGLELFFHDGHPVLTIQGPLGRKQYRGQSWGAFNCGQWVFVCIAYSSSGVSVWVGDVLAIDDTDGYVGSLTNPADVLVGSGGYDGGAVGLIDRLTWYDHAMSVFEITGGSYLEGHSGADGGFMVPAFSRRFNFTEGRGIIVMDVTGELTGLLHAAGWAADNDQIPLTSPVRGRDRNWPGSDDKLDEFSKPYNRVDW